MEATSSFLSVLCEYGLFLAETITIVIAVIIVTAVVISLAAKGKERGKDTIEVKNINEKFDELKEIAQEEILDKKELKKLQKEKKAEEKARKENDEKRPRIFVINFDGDTEAAQVENLREEVTTILALAEKDDEVAICLESPGGVVHGYGLAASQLDRIKQHNIPLTVIVDKVAASGGYMMACIADKIISAPFAIIGSIGVVLQIPNFNRLLKKHDVDYETVTGGEYKRTLTLFGENTDKARKKAKEEIDEVHALFKDFVCKYRPNLDISKVATGEHWFGLKALELQLVDEISTSDDYLIAKSKEADIYQITRIEKQSLKEKLASAAELTISGLIKRIRKEERTSQYS
ncbi:MAG: protease SohB [Gammaproteobacteria bacterium]|nr:MAG: protease SohB [Gammaproteobacteria bacterium]